VTSGSGQSRIASSSSAMVKIRHPDVAREALPLRLRQRRHGLGERDLRVRPMHHEQIDLVDAEILQALVDRARKVIGAQIFVRHLGGEENLVARHPRCADPFADAAFGAVFPRGVDVAISELERGGDDLAAIAQRGRAVTDGRHLGAVRGQFGDRRECH
jgi:hypothetical protein